MFSQVTQVGNIYQLAPPVESLQWCKVPGSNVNISSSVEADAQLDRLLPTLLECFAIVFCGFLAGKCNLISPTDIKGLNDFTTYFSLPPLIFLNLVTIDFHNVNWHFVLGILLGKIAVFVLVAMVTATVHRPLSLSYAGIYGIFCTQGNDFGLAYPIVSSLYGSKRPLYAGYMYLIAPTSLLFTNPMGFFLMEAQKSRNALSDSSIKKESLFQRFLKTLVSVSWNVFKNPAVFVTLLGILGNFLFQNGLPSVLYGILQVLSAAFSSAVLFLLGFSVVRCGNAGSTTKEGLLIPAVLIIAKMLISPLIMRGTVVLMCSSATDVDDLADYGFLYGLIPPGPIVMLFAAEYCLRTEMMASTMVMCTALFAPLMFVLARMLTLKVRGIGEFAGELQTTMLVLSALGIIACVWTGIGLFIGNKFKSTLYKITGFLMLSQVIMCIGVFMWAVLQSELAWVAFFQVAFVAAGQLMSRLWAALLALYMVIRERNPEAPFVQNLSWPTAFGFGIPAASVLMLLVMTSVGKCQPELHKELPLFIYGNSEAIASIVVLSVCLSITTFSLILYYRALNRFTASKNRESHCKNSVSLNFQIGLRESDGLQKELADGAGFAVYKLTKTLSDPEISGKSGCKKSKDVTFVSITENLQEMEKTRPPDGRECKIDPTMCDVKSSQSSLDIVSVTSSNQSNSTSSSVDFDDQSLTRKSHQHLRHVMLLIICSISMAVGLTVSTWKLSSQQSSGLFVAMEFLDAILNVGQALFVFLVFWRESKHILNPVTKKLRKVRRGIYNLEEDLTDDRTANLCRQFRKYHWSNCQRDLPKTFSTEDRSYCNCFTGKEFVDWLLAVGLSTHRTPAEIHGQELLRGGLMVSANDAVQFHDSHAYYYQLRDSEKYT